jgi:hypothetical protein
VEDPVTDSRQTTMAEAEILDFVLRRAAHCSSYLVSFGIVESYHCYLAFCFLLLSSPLPFASTLLSLLISFEE